MTKKIKIVEMPRQRDNVITFDAKQNNKGEKLFESLPD